MAEDPSPWGCQEETNRVRQVIITLGDELPNKHAERVHLLVTHFVLEFFHWPDFSGSTFLYCSFSIISYSFSITAPVSPPLVPKFGAPGPILLPNSKAHPRRQPPLSKTCRQVILGPSGARGGSLRSLNSLTLRTQEADSVWRIKLSFTCGFVL